MKIIKDELRQINLHPLVIYCIVSPKDPKERIEALNRLNRYKAYTRGLFKFQLIERDGTFNEDLTPDLIDKIKRCNMFVRLIDDGSNCFCYARNKVNYNLSPDEIDYSIQKFVVDVCMQNISHLESRTAQCAHQEDSSQQMWTLHRMQQVFQEALNLKKARHISWSRLIDDEVSVSSNGILHAEKVVLDSSESRLTQKDNQLKKFIRQLEETLASEVNKEWLLAELRRVDEAPSLEESDENAQSSVKRKPTISVEIKQVVKQTLKSGREKTAYGFVFTIDDETYSVYLGGKEQTMIYACALLRQKMGQKMYRHEFINNSRGLSPETEFTREKAKPWIKKIYEFLFKNDSCEFAKWYSKLETNSGQPLNQGKSQINSKIKDNLPESAVYFCKVNTKSDDLGDTYYDIQIPAEKITVPEELVNR